MRPTLFITGCMLFNIEAKKARGLLGAMELRKGLGLVGEVFRGETFANFPGNIAIGHVRYSTAGDESVRSAQPLAASCRLGEIALAHNGNLVNADSLREMLTDEGVIFHTTSDSESILNLICQHGTRGILSGIISKAHMF